MTASFFSLLLAAAAVSRQQLLVRATSSSSTPGTTLFFENDGNWTAHGSRPSALYVSVPASHSSAASVCAGYGETLLSCTAFADFQNSFSYQEYLGAIAADQLLWSSCSDSSPYDITGAVASNTSSVAALPYLCTNSAPLVDKVDMDYSAFPRVNASFNGTTYEGLRDHMTFRFAGVPFAQPPTGSLRFQPAVPANSTAYVNATAYSPACLQYGYFDGNSYGLNPWGNSEDCLYLNIYTPFIPSLSQSAGNASATGLQGKPVMVWYYGGGDTQGSAADSTFDGASLVSRSDVVVVTINYRLNIFGSLTLNDGVINGNQMLTDKILGLRWVKANIAAFGGNPDNITIFGQSAGGGSVVNLISAVTTFGENLFQNAIIQSAKSNVESAETVANASLPYIDDLCPNVTGTERLTCLQALPADTLLNVTNYATAWSPSIDGVNIIDYPPAQWALGPQYINSVNLLSGNMMEEWQSLATTSLAPNMTNFTEAVLYNLTNDGAISQEQANLILESGKWLVTNETVTNGSVVYDSVYNASVHIGTEAALVCSGTVLYQIAAASRAFKTHWQYAHQRGYALSYYDFYDLCTFPVGAPDTPYYRCHSGDLYEVWGTYYIFGQPVRAPEDIYYTNAIQDIWGWFARTGSPIVDPAYLKARNYTSTETFFDGFDWPQFTVASQKLASLQWPESEITAPLYQDHCDLLEQYQTYPGLTLQPSTA